MLMPKRKPALVKPESENRLPSPSVVPAPLTSRFAPSQTAIRETVESLVIAFVLAFLFRTFEAEMFVIPTGSMAPTLMGRHKDLVCPKCSYSFTANAASEIDQNSGEATHNEVSFATCPMCHYTIRLGIPPPEGPQGGDERSFNGDRIVVDKLAYQLGEPRRWDVAVFKFPGKADQNYIKRLVGVGNETVRLQYGDVFVKPAGENKFHIARKTPNKLLAVLQPVYDNDYVCKALDEADWPQRWQALKPGKPDEWQPDDQPGAWTARDNNRSFATDGTAAEPVWIRYHHFEPNFEQWQRIQDWLDLKKESSPPFKDEPPPPLLISDFTAYDSSAPTSEQAVRLSGQGQHWVGDLALECELDVRGSTGEVVLELRKGGPKFTCQFNLSNGQAELGIDRQPGFHPTAATAVCGPGTYRVRFSNVDEQLRLWVNGAVVQFDAPTGQQDKDLNTIYPGLDNHRPQKSDLSPVGIASRQAAVEVRQLRIRRDLYYISAGKRLEYPAGDEVRSNPTVLDQFYDPGRCDFPLAKGQFLMLGDNSSSSADGRLWDDNGRDVDYFVRRDLLIGRALYIFWPHSWDGPDIDGWHVCPYFPNFRRMHFVR
jgi:signal peptidase I